MKHFQCLVILLFSSLFHRQDDGRTSSVDHETAVKDKEKKEKKSFSFLQKKKKSLHPLVQDIFFAMLIFVSRHKMSRRWMAHKKKQIRL